MSNLSGFVKRLRDIMRNDAGINGDAQRIEQIAWMLFLKVYDAKEQDWKWDDDEYVSIIPEECRWQNWAVDDHTGTALTGDKLLDFVNNTLFPVLKGTDIKDSKSTYGHFKKVTIYSGSSLPNNLNGTISGEQIPQSGATKIFSKYGRSLL